MQLLLKRALFGVNEENIFLSFHLSYHDNRCFMLSNLKEPSSFNGFEFVRVGRLSKSHIRPEVSDVFADLLRKKASKGEGDSAERGREGKKQKLLTIRHFFRKQKFHREPSPLRTTTHFFTPRYSLSSNYYEGSTKSEAQKLFTKKNTLGHYPWKGKDY